MSDERFDPRFDPAFQRGYTGPVPVPVGQPTTRIEKPAQRAVELEQAAPQPEQDDLVDGPPESPVRRTNPFLVALGVIAAALIGGGLYLISRIRDLFASTQNQADFDFVTMQVLMTLAPLMVCLGVATALGVLFIYAVRWGRRSRA